MKFQEKEVKDIYEEFVKGNKIQPRDEVGGFREFLKFLEIDFYDWVRENLRCYFRDEGLLDSAKGTMPRNL